MRRVTPASLLVLAVCGVCFAGNAQLLKLAPDYLMKGWAPVQGTSTYAAGEALTNIYNGGYETYTKAGVVEALRRMYGQKTKYVEVTVHRMKSPAAARAFLADRYKMETHKKAPTDAKFKRFQVSGSGSTTAYAIEKAWYLTVVVYDSTTPGRKLASDFRTALEQRAAKQ